MSQYEARLQHDLDEIHTRITAVGERVRDAIDGAMQAVAAGDVERLHGAVLADLPVNREIRAIDALCHAFVARHQPAARHLRFVASALRLTVSLERVGDYAAAIGRVGARLQAPIPQSMMDTLLGVTLDTCLMLEQATRAYLDEDPELARGTKALADRVDTRIQGFFDEVFATDALSLHEGYSILSIASRLERASDQAKNVCEEVIFVQTGKTKPPKTYRVLFVDRRNDLVGPLAKALAAQAFQHSGAFQTAGTEPADTMRDALAAAGGTAVTDSRPSSLGALTSAPPPYHVIVLLQDLPIDVLGDVPFSTSVVRWPSGAAADGGLDDAGVQALVDDLNARTADLMELLRGPDAD